MKRQLPLLFVLVLSCTEKQSEDNDPVDTTSPPPPETEENDTPDTPQDTADTGVIDSNSEPDVCALSEQERVVQILPTQLEEAAQLTLMPGEGESYTLNKIEGDEGWFVLEVPSWMCEVQLYTEENVVLELLSSPDWEAGAVAEVYGECDGDNLYLYSWIFHAWGSYIVHVQAPNMTEVWLGSVLLLES